MKKIIINNMGCLLAFAALLVVNSCIDEEFPTQGASTAQVDETSHPFEMLVNGMKSMMITQTNYYDESYRGTWYATQDWGYPCYMYIKETMLDGFPTTDASWNYQLYFEKASNLTAASAYPFYFYYSLIKNANRILNYRQEGDADETTLQYLGMTRVYRALAYMDLTMMYEFYATGNAELNAKARPVMGLTVPLVTELTTNDEAKNNPRAPFYTMYRFIYNDLSKAEQWLKGYERNEKNDVNVDVVNGLLARFWLNLGTRFSKSPDDLAKQLEHEADNDGFAPLQVTSANDCFRKAHEYAGKVIAAGYQPVTEEQWKDQNTGFNKANQAWVWDMRFTSKEQTTDYWCSHIGLTASEPTWAMPSYGNAYRCISKRYYDKMQQGDWRSTSWIAPEDAGAVTTPEKYHCQLKDETAATVLNRTNFSRLPAYANLKFRPADGSMDDDQTGMLCDVPLMRVEEMYFIQIECEYYLNGLAAGQQALERFMNTYRNTRGNYSAQQANYGTAFIYELMAQKYIEFWGEGIMYNDFKRLRMSVVRTYEGSNYLDTYLLDSDDGSCAPWLNFYLPEMERSFNKALEEQMNPDPTPYC